MFCPEILAPAGNLFKLQTAVRYGADAVYIAGQEFGLRSAADNFTVREIYKGCAYAHERGAKVYLVLNGFLFDEELQRLPGFLEQIADAGIDAAIVSDLGVLRTVREHSGITLHLSTQTSTINRFAARFWRGEGVRRIVLGREVTIEQAATIKEAAGVEVEMFVHGAMCMAYSGHCTISNYTAGRDSNRGGCIQSCRFAYSLSRERTGAGPEDTLLSAKDLRGIDVLHLFAAHGIDSLKIEGRMKSPLYVATTVRAYRLARRALLEGLEPDPELPRELEAMGHRDYSEGNLTLPAGDDATFHQESALPQTHQMAGYVVERKAGEYLALLLLNPLHKGEPLELLAEDGGNLPLDTHAMEDLRGMPLAKAAPNRVVLVPDRPGAGEHLILRKPIDVEAHRHSVLAV